MPVNKCTQSLGTKTVRKMQLQIWAMSITVGRGFAGIFLAKPVHKRDCKALRTLDSETYGSLVQEIYKDSPKLCDNRNPPICPPQETLSRKLICFQRNENVSKLQMNF